MAIGEDIDIASQALFNTDVDMNLFLIKFLLAILFIIVGIFLGKIIKYILKKISDRLELEKKVKGSFIDLFLTVVKWSIYIIFVNMALIQLPIPSLTILLSKILIVIPALVASLVIIAIGFGIAVYLREIIEDSEVTGWKILSQYFFLFILYVAGVYALKIALISLDDLISNILIGVFSVIVGVGVAYYFVKKELMHRKEYREN